MDDEPQLTERTDIGDEWLPGGMGQIWRKHGEVLLERERARPGGLRSGVENLTRICFVLQVRGSLRRCTMSGTRSGFPEG